MWQIITKDDCEKCDWLKDKLKDRTDVEFINAKTKEGMAHLAFYEQLETGKYPMLLLEDEQVITIAAQIKKHIEVNS